MPPLNCKTYNLTQSMNTAIGSSCTCNNNRVAGQLANYTLNFTLNSDKLCTLSLKAIKVCSIIFNQGTISRHSLQRTHSLEWS